MEQCHIWLYIWKKTNFWRFGGSLEKLMLPCPLNMKKNGDQWASILLTLEWIKFEDSEKLTKYPQDCFITCQNDP